MKTVQHRRIVYYTAIVVSSVFASPGRLMAIDYGNIQIVENDSGNNESSVTATIPGGQSTTDFFVQSGSGSGTNKGDYVVRIGASNADDVAGGILIGSVSENGRTTGSPNGFAIAMVAPQTITGDSISGYWYMPVNTAGNVVTSREINSNVAAAYFPFAEGWLAGHAQNSSNGGALTGLHATAGLTLGTHFIDDGSGRSRVYLPGVNAMTDGVLLVNGGKNEDNFALSRPAADATGTHFQISNHHTTANAGSEEQDPVAFAYVPLGTKNATLGRILGNGLATVSQGEFSVQDAGSGQFRLSIAGHSPTTGTLIVTPEGMGTNNVDNIVTYQASGNSWIVQTRDLPGVSLQTLEPTEGAFNFAFLPFDAPPTAPGNRPTFNPAGVGAATVNITAFTNGNGASDMYAAVSYGTAGMYVHENNRGDNTMGFGDGPMKVAGGVLLGTISEHVRNNSAVGGLNDYSTISLYSSDGNWVVSTAAAAAQPSGVQEHNINFATAYFPHGAGFQTGGQIAENGGAGIVNLVLAGAGDTRTSGVLMANSFGNEDNFTTVQPTTDGSGWTVRNHDNAASLQSTGINYAFLPYGTENLIAGQVNPAGHLHSRTGDFELTREGTGLYRLTIDGQSPQDGMLLLTATHNSNSSDNIVVYRPDGNSFLIQGIDMHNNNTHGPQDTDFQFAYLSYNNPIANPQLRTLAPTTPVGALLNVRENNTSNAATSVSVNTVGSDFFTIRSANRGDYDVNIDGLPLQLQSGVMLATLRQNGTGGTVSAVQNGLSNNTYLATNLFGSNAEFNTSVGATFFPFDSGFFGAHVASEGTVIGGSPVENTPPGTSLTHSGTGLYQLNLPGVNAQTDGLLFAINGGNEVGAVTAAVNPNGSWTVGRYGQVRSLTDGAFSLLFLPTSVNDYSAASTYFTENLVGGRIGDDGSVLMGIGEFDLSHGSTGEYLLTLVGDGSPLDGTLLLTASGLRNGQPDDTVFSYEALGDNFLIQARDLAGNLRDAQFVFAFNSFDNPLALASSELVVPEPASLVAWLLLGIVGVAVARRLHLNSRTQ